MRARRLTVAVCVGASLWGAAAMGGRASGSTRRSAAPVPPPWGVWGTYKPLVGDFNGDGRDDIFWHAEGHGADSVWFGNANRHFTVVPEDVFYRYKPAVFDRNHDGRDDILWFSASVNVPLWLGNADRTFTNSALSTPGPWFTPIAGDFNGDGRDDIVFDAPFRGKDYQWLGDPTLHYTKRLIHINGDFGFVVADFNGDGRDDLFLEPRDSTSSAYIGLAKPDGSFAFRVAAGAPRGGKVFAVDANRDGYDDLFFYGPGHLPDSVWYGSAAGIPDGRVATEVEGSDYHPFVGDFDGDGHPDLFWYAPGGAADHLWFDVPHQR